MNNTSINITAVGDGIADDTAAIQAALFSGAPVVNIPNGSYRITKTLLVPCHTHIRASKNARLFLCGDVPKKRGDFLLSNADTVNGNEDIAITGGIWDGNNQGKYNTKNLDLFAPDAYSGTVLNFVNVKGLSLSDMTVANSVTYYVRLAHLDGFTIKNIDFFSEKKAFNQDGLHFGGYVKNGTVENIRAKTDGQTNDDFIALNADDCVTRLENFDLPRGPIEDITFKNLYAKDCHTMVRLLSVTAPIRRIRFENVTAGCRCFGINMDAARYCRTPLFKDADCPDGVGKIEDISFDNVTLWFSRENQKNALIGMESNTKRFTITNFNRPDFDLSPDSPTLLVRNVNDMRVSVNGVLSAEGNLKYVGDVFEMKESFSELTVE